MHQRAASRETRARWGEADPHKEGREKREKRRKRENKRG